jgi:hypothetical protein
MPVGNDLGKRMGKYAYFVRARSTRRVVAQHKRPVQGIYIILTYARNNKNAVVTDQPLRKYNAG